MATVEMDAKPALTGRPPWMERPSWFGRGAKTVTIVVISALVIYPFLAVVATSLSSESDIAASGGLVIWPSHPTFDAYRYVFSGGIVSQALWISFLVTVVGTALSMAATIGMAYGLSRSGVVGGRFFLTTALFTMLFTPGVIPMFLTVQKLGLYNTLASLVVPSLVSAFNLVVLRSFFMNLPAELLDAARIDGLGDWRILTRVVLPLSKAVLAVVALFYAVSYWNAFFNALLYLNDTSKWPLALVLRGLVIGGEATSAANEGVVPQQAVQMAVVVVSVVPIAAVYPFLQRYFTKGVLTGAVKG
ncbi:putative aldouronate transport system permease protein [Catenulispora sp. MAP12-49]